MSKTRFPLNLVLEYLAVQQESQVYIVGGGIVAILAPPILFYLIGIGTHSIILLILGFVLIAHISFFGYMFYVSQRGNLDAEVKPSPNTLPESLREFDEKLLFLKFKQIGVFKRAKYLHRDRYTYLSENQDVVVYAIDQRGSAQILLCCYLKSGMTVTTNYPFGAKAKSSKIISEVVKSSVEAAFDYHYHQVAQLKAEHGIPTRFNSLPEILDWEDNQRVLRASYNSGLKLFGILGIRLVIGFIVSQVLMILLFAIFNTAWQLNISEDLPVFYTTLINAVSLIFFIIVLVWAFRPLYSPETVEDRKKKKL
ncbi:MAG: hypothetical protein AAF846_17410 [Chloroflexota bacterium]